MADAMASLLGAALGGPAGLSQPMATMAAPVAAPVNSPAGGQAGAPFADLLTDAVGSVDRLEQQAKSAVEGLMTGTGVDVHEAMIATEKAGMAFELVLSVRNKALAAYQQVLGMQF